MTKLGVNITLEKNQLLYKAGDIPNCCFYIVSGQIVSFEYTASGSERIFSTSRPGELILVPAMVVVHPLVLSFKASEKSTLIRIKREDMFGAMSADPEFSAQLVYSLSMRLITSVEESRERGSYNVSWRVCNYLLSMAEQYGIEYDGKTLIQEKLSQQSMANTLHANRVTIARAIRELKDYALIEYINGYYCIRNPEKLRKHMDYLESVSSGDS